MEGNGNGNGKSLPVQLTRKDFVSDQDVRWCPGCGDYAILAQVQKVMPEIGVARENIVFVSGIGCSSRFPYYMNTYGFHGIHGRAPAIATGLKLARPELTVFVATGDGDGLSIGGNHLIHALRRNVDLKIMLFDNRIYGLTKGQYSPTSELGKKAKSTPYGSIDRPFNPLSVALAAEATFVARCLDTDAALLQTLMKRAAAHKGGAFIHILQNCNIFNDGAFEHISEKTVKAERQLLLEHGKPLLFGKDRKKGIRVRGFLPEVVTVGEDGVTEADILVHDEAAPTPALAFLLSRLDHPEFPVPMGVFRAVNHPTYESLSVEQEQRITKQKGPGDLRSLLHGGETWTVS